MLKPHKEQQPSAPAGSHYIHAWHTRCGLPGPEVTQATGVSAHLPESNPCANIPHDGHIMHDGRCERHWCDAWEVSGPARQQWAICRSGGVHRVRDIRKDVPLTWVQVCWEAFPYLQHGWDMCRSRQLTWLDRSGCHTWGGRSAVVGCDVGYCSGRPAVGDAVATAVVGRES